MAEVIGLVSLSIQCCHLCEGLTKYYSDYRSYSKEINQIILETDELKSICQNIECELQRLPQIQVVVVQQIKRLIVSCESGIQNLSDTLGQCISTQLPTDFPIKLHSFRVRAAYPFKKRTLQTLRNNVQILRNNMQSALMILHLHISISLLATSSSTKTTVRDNQNLLQKFSLPLQAISDGVPVAQQQTEDIQDDVRSLRKDISVHQKKGFEEFAKLDRSIDKGTENIQIAIVKRLDKYSADMDRLLTLQNSELGKQKNEIEALNQRITSLQIGMISQPSLLRSVCEQNDQFNNFSGCYPATSPGYTRLRHSMKSREQCCGCQLSLPGSASKSYRLDFTRNLHWRLKLALHILSHRPSCPLLHRYIISVKGCGLLLNRAVEASITITCGAGGFSISPVMQCLRLVPYDSPVFQFVNWSSAFKGGLVKSTAEFDNILHENISKIVLLFEAGKASAYDVAPGRFTLLHEASPYYQGSLSYFAQQNQLPESPLFESLMRFYERLIKLCVPLNWVDMNNQTFMDYFVTRRCRARDPLSLSVWTSRLLDVGAELSYNSGNKERYDLHISRDDRSTIFLFAKSSKFLHALSCNDLSVSILRKSEQDMLGILKQFPQSIHESNQWGQTPLHLAVDWPLGMKRLLDYGANVDSRDDLGMKPLEYAIRFGFAEAVHNLIKAGCSLVLYGTVDALSFANKFLPWAEGGCSDIGFDMSTKNRKSVLETLITSLAERRRGLRSQLATSLPRKSIDACWTQDDQVLDEHAPYVKGLLSSHGLLSPRKSSLIILPTVYNVNYLTVELAEMLWQAGFRDIDVPDRGGRTPLMRYGFEGWWPGNLECIIKTTTWLIKRGANIHRRHHSYVNRDPKRAIWVTDKKLTNTALHHVAAGIAGCVRHKFRYYLEKTEQFGEKQEFSLMVGAQWFRDEIRRQNETLREGLADIFSDTMSDYCICACSTQGCLASTILQRTVYFQLRIEIWQDLYPEKDVEVPYFRKLGMLMTENVIALLGSYNECQAWLADALIRFQTFQELELRHTCCCYDWWIKDFTQHDPDEVKEIRDEDSEKIELLEELMVEFSEKRGGQDVMTFLKGYWSTRMDEVKRFQGEVDKDKLREIGVILEENGPGESSIEELEDE